MRSWVIVIAHGLWGWARNRNGFQISRIGGRWSLSLPVRVYRSCPFLCGWTGTVDEGGDAGDMFSPEHDRAVERADAEDYAHLAAAHSEVAPRAVHRVIGPWRPVRNG